MLFCVVILTLLELSGKLHSDKVIEVFEMHHSVVCVGYGFLQEKKKLKPEFVGLPGKQLGELRKQGVVLDAYYENPMFAFLGDTTVQFFEEQAAVEARGEESIFRFPLIIVECTFLGTDEEDEERARNKKHVYWPHLKPFIVAHPSILFVLIHFSHRYNSAQIREFFEKESLTNVVPFVASKEYAIVEAEQNDDDDDH
jgi:ribonuclease Z